MILTCGFLKALEKTLFHFFFRVGFVRLHKKLFIFYAVPVRLKRCRLLSVLIPKLIVQSTKVSSLQGANRVADYLSIYTLTSYISNLIG